MNDEAERFGPYRILRTLGEGGMGVVYEAEQFQPVRRRVALKVLRTGLDSRAFVARFDIERQALAVMDHPHIARVIDAGEFAGRPYYAMELVAGVSLTVFCDEQRLSTRERLELFLDVCHAVHHAHQRGVIHRDLKPSNVLIALQDDRPVAKVIDFGIAKAIGQRLTESTVVTKVGETLGTPAYMSPEQWHGDFPDVDTRTDIYSMGVMLYEMLTGRLPYDTQRLVRAGGGASSLLRELTPTTPSALVRSLGADRDTLARARRTDARTWAHDLKGDLDWITLKAMASDRRRRYETARELGQDIERHLRSQPVLARPPSAAYRIGRFAVRHRIGVGMAAGALLAATALGVQAVLQSRRVARERDRAQLEAAKARALNEFLQRTLLAPDPLDGIGRDATIAQALDSATVRLGREPPETPAVEAAVKSSMGWAYFRLAEYDKAEPLMTSALAIRESLTPPDSEGLAESLVRVAQLHNKRGRYDSAARLFERGIAVRRAVNGSGSSELGGALAVFGGFLRDRGDSANALTRFVEAGEIFGALGDSMGMAMVDDHVSLLEYGRGHLADAERLIRRSLEYRRRKFGRHPLVAGQLSNLGAVLEDLKRPGDAEQAYREALEIGVPSLGEDHDVVSAVLNNLGLLLSNQGRYAEALPFMQRALAADERKLGPDNPAVAIDALNLAQALCRNRPAAEGVDLATRAVRIFAKTDPDSWTEGQARIVRGSCLTGLERFDEAERELRIGLTQLEGGLGPTHRRVDSAKARLAELARARARPR